MKKHKHNLSTESGNIFFVLFSAVALVGVVGAATSNLLAGPVTTVSKVNHQTAVNARMETAAHMIFVASAKDPAGDCDGDGLTEPVAPVACSTAPAGAGCIPGNLGASGVDAWNTPFAYCAYDHGLRDAAACPDRLAGDNPTGPVLIAIISAGPDKVPAPLVRKGVPRSSHRLLWVNFNEPIIAGRLEIGIGNSKEPGILSRPH